jgi:3'(2'), 5'-bisphosphate nucleotidase
MSADVRDSLQQSAQARVRNSVTRDALAAVMAVAEQAGLAIMAVYNEPARWAVTEKLDASPITAADIAAHRSIVMGLQALADKTLASLPVLSEESSPEDLQGRRDWAAYWLVDPLDGTKEFIARNGEFSVNIALVVGHEAVLGVVYGPANGVSYVAAEGVGSFRVGPEAVIETTAVAEAISSVSANKAASAWMSIQARAPNWSASNGTLNLTVSRRHGLERLAHFEQSLQAAGWKVDSIPAGSAFKICAVAEGRAHAYPRFGPTSEWDTAAAQVVLEQAGGELVDANGRRFLYNCRSTLLNGDFLAVAKASEPWLTHWPS